MADTKAFFDLVDREGLVLETIDPRRVSQIGVAQGDGAAPAKKAEE